MVRVLKTQTVQSIGYILIWCFYYTIKSIRKGAKNQYFQGFQEFLKAFGCSISRPDISQSNCCQWSWRTSWLERGQWNLPMYFDTLVQKNKTIRFPQQSFYPITSFPTKKVQRAAPWIHVKLLFHNGTQSVDQLSHIRVTGQDIEFVSGCDIT